MKKLISCVLALVLALSLVPSAFAAEGASVDKFTDVPADAWYRDELAYALHNGYISGTSETTFDPDALVTRGQFVTILGRMLGADTSKYTTTEFEDVDMKSWYGPYVEWARDKGIVNGISSKAFSPTNNITVEQVGTILDNCIRKMGLQTKGTPVTYNDMSKVSKWAVSSMTTMSLFNLLPTDAAGNVNPSSFATRAYSTSSLVRLAKSSGLGTEPATVGTIGPDTIVDETQSAAYQSDATAAAVKRIHDELWDGGVITSSSTEKEKAIAYYDWMCQFCRYGVGKHLGYEEYQSHMAYGALVNGYAVCDGFAHAYKALLDYEGIECKFVGDYEKHHAWNEAILDGKEYHIDVSHSAGQAIGSDGRYNEETASFIRDKWFMDEDDWLNKHFGPTMD